MMTQTDLQRIDDLLEKRFAKELKPIKADISTIKKDIRLIVRFFDSEILAIGRRATKIEKHIGIISPE